MNGNLRWWHIGLIVSIIAALLKFFVEFAVVLFHFIKKNRNFPIFGVYFWMNKYGAKIGCAIIAVCQVIFLFYALSMQLHVFDSPMFGVIPPIFGLFAAIVGVSLHLHCFIRWLFGWLVIALICIDITGTALLESDIRCLQDGLCDVTSLPDINWLWVNFVFRIISLFGNIYSMFVCCFVTWEMGCCCFQNDSENCCYRCDRYPLTAWAPVFDGRTTAEAVFDMTMAKQLRDGVQKHRSRKPEANDLDTLKRSSSFERAANKTTVIQSLRSDNYDITRAELPK